MPHRGGCFSTRRLTKSEILALLVYDWLFSEPTQVCKPNTVHLDTEIGDSENSSGSSSFCMRSWFFGFRARKAVLKNVTEMVYFLKNDQI